MSEDLKPIPNAAYPAISVIVPCRNETKTIDLCLKSILGQGDVPGGFEVLVVDGMSDDGTMPKLRAWAQKDARLRILENPHKTTSCGLNIGIRASRGRYIVRMDAHHSYASDYLAQGLSASLASGADNVGGGFYAVGTGVFQQAIAAAHHSAFASGGARWRNPDYEGPADTVFGGFFRREVFHRMGLFDEELIRNQDDEFNLRLLRSGGTIWHSPKVKSWYTPRASLASLWRQYAQYGYWKVRLIQKHKGPASFRHLIPGAWLGMLAILSCLSSISKSAFFILMSVLTLYLCATAAAALFTARRFGWRLLPVLPLVFFVYHFGYGYGFLRGMMDFMVLRRGGSSAFARYKR